MAHRPVASILILTATMILALPAKGQQNVNPNSDDAHANLGMALANKGNLDGSIAEEREALRLNPNNGNAHYFLGIALERKGNYQEALGEYRAAHELAPQNPAFREGYERLSKRLNH